MKFNFRYSAFKLITMAVLPICCLSCINKNNTLGGSYIAESEKYDVYTAEIPLEEIEMRIADDISGFSATRITVGAIRDDEFGVTTRSGAITLVPIHRPLNFGKNPKFKSFTLTLAQDTTLSVSQADEKKILQNINVYELEERVGVPDFNSNNTNIKHSVKRITNGIPVYNGKGPLTFSFTKEFGEKYMTMSEDLQKGKIDEYLKKFPGIYLKTDEPNGNGGRINMFKHNMQLNNNLVKDSYAKLEFSAEYKGKNVDTSFLFYFGAQEFQNIDSLINRGGKIDQFAFNVTGHSTRMMAGKAFDKIYVEGGGGLKPVIPAESMRKACIDAISMKGNPKEAIITKATIHLPFEFPADYKSMYKYPNILSPSCKIKGKKKSTFANITDASNSSENMGDLDRSLLEYAPDISFYLQKLLKLKDKTKYKEFDLWLMIMAKEVKIKNNAMSQRERQLQELARINALNNFYNGYGGGYGGYYGGRYNYGTNYLMERYAASQSQSKKEIYVAIDKDRYYNATLIGPTATSSKKPKLEITFALPKK